MPSDWLLLITVFFAAIVRGYTGFALSAIVIVIITYWIPARELVPLMLLLEFTASLVFVRSVSGETNWKTIGLIFAGCLITTPIALYALAHLQPLVTRTIIAAMVFAATVIVLIAPRLKVAPGTSVWLTTGIAMGAFGGLGSLSGMAGMVALQLVDMHALKARAMMISILLVVSVQTSGFAYLNGLMTQQVMSRYAFTSDPFRHHVDTIGYSAQWLLTDRWYRMLFSDSEPGILADLE